jgi:SIR2-like domain
MKVPRKTTPRNHGLSFDNALPLLASFWHRGILVPFIGSGISRPALNGWDDFLWRLLELLKLKTGKPAKGRQDLTTAEKYRLAEIATMALRSFPIPEQADIVRKALKSVDSQGTVQATDNTKALAMTYWPLVVTTNYDDLYIRALADNSAFKRGIQVYGRGRSDCHQVLKSLDDDLPPILWAVQGFVGQLAIPTSHYSVSGPRLHALIKQVVIGHQQYVQATNGEPHFRRTFAELFRRRSLLFVGSGLQEDYIVSLFSEIVHHHGLGSLPHFALFDRETQVDQWFLRTKLGINVLRYPDHSALPGRLERIAKAARWSHRLSDDTIAVPAPSQDAIPNEVGYYVGGSRNNPLRVRCVFSPLPTPDHTQQQASIVSVGRWENKPLLGKQAHGHLRRARMEGVLDEAVGAERWRPLTGKASYVFRFGKRSPIFAVAARRRDVHGKQHDRRDLRIIRDALSAALMAVEKAGYTTVFVAAIAAGEKSGLHPVHSFAQALRGVFAFSKLSAGRLEDIRFHLVDARVWALIASGKLSIAQLLSSEVLPFEVEVHDSEENIENLRVMLPGVPSINEVLRHTRLLRKHWKIFISPPPTDENRSDWVEASPDEDITSTMRVILKPKAPNV